jgi:hypothetical protein
MKEIIRSGAASSAVARVLSVSVLTAALFIGGCAKPSEQDQQYLALLEKRFGDHYSFKFEDEFYVHAVSKGGHEISGGEAEEIYKLFAFSDFERKVRRESSHIYFNFFASDGRFLYQLAYDPGSGKIERSNTPHH